MRCLAPAAAVAVGLGLSLSAPASIAAPAAAAATPAAANPAAAPDPDVEPAALEALSRMSAYLKTLTAFELRAETTLDLVTLDGQRLQVGGVSQYKVRRPDGFLIDVDSDYKKRRFYYDGKAFTVFAPELGYYATTTAPPTIAQTLEVIEARYGISLPLVDLFRWNDPNEHRAETLETGFVVGSAAVDGVATDHYAFRQGDRDWEIWIEKGQRPLPRKLVIVDRKDDSRPAYIARLSWTLNPSLPADTFVFKPSADLKKIRLAALDQ